MIWLITYGLVSISHAKVEYFHCQEKSAKLILPDCIFALNRSCTIKNNSQRYSNYFYLTFSPSSVEQLPIMSFFTKKEKKIKTFSASLVQQWHITSECCTPLSILQPKNIHKDFEGGRAECIDHCIILGH